MHNIVFWKQLEYFKILKKKEPLFQSLFFKDLSVTIKFIFEEVNMGYYPSKKPGGVKKTA